METFDPAEVFKGEFSVFAHFYRPPVGGGPLCRSVLEIRRLNCEATKPDAIVVMMNPGGSLAKAEREPPSAPEPRTMVDTVPDTTQFQVMRVMRARHWNFVRVLNLSDLCEPKSSVFAKKADTRHSIFSEARQRELADLLEPGVPVIRAWGVSYKLRSLAALASSALARHPVVGWEKKDLPGHFYHPLQRQPGGQQKWLEKILPQLSSSATSRR